ncbi:transporter substrate-binding domain-containing protein [uncultured Pseudodesulfovibrio sp.]|uniref:substrate-binding periplasmic protein n=1 Tax=uncultured Pseudodesulfovibrio sp. TaxID=2035858 RepID=UPI0029C7AC5C|nr:transporter substrate-binding domain-containing protein [uncultured Pseudodesulfovibrio sp.]
MRLLTPLSSLLLILASLVVSASPAFAANPIVIFGNDCKPPKSWMHNGRPKGVLVDILHEIEARTGLSFDIRLMPWKRAYMSALEGRGGIFGLSKNMERMSLFDFSEVMYVDEMRIVVLKGREFTYREPEDLKGMTLGITRGASYGDEFDRAKGRIFIPSEDSGPISRLRMLLAGRIDAALIGPGEASVRFTISQDTMLMENSDQFVILDTPFVQDDNFIGFPKNSKRRKLLDQIDHALLDMQGDGTIQRIEARY